MKRIKTPTFPAQKSVLAMAGAAVILLGAAAPMAHALPYPTEVLADNPLAYYRMEETHPASTMADSSTTALDGTHVGSIDSDVISASLPGLDSASRYNDNADRSGRTDDGVLDNLSSWTAEAWIRTTGNDTGIILTNILHGTADGFQLAINGSGHFEATHDNGPRETFSSGFTVNDDQPHHVVAAFDGSTMNLYVDGGLKSSTAGSAGAGDGTSMVIAVGHSLVSPLFAVIDEVAIYDYALSSERVQAHFIAAVPEPSTGALALLSALAAVWLRRGRVVHNRNA